jgi:hypothetical protein
MKNRHSKIPYKKLHKDIIKLLTKAEAAYLLGNNVDRYTNSEKAISLMIDLQDKVKNLDKYNNLANIYRSLYVQLDASLRNKDKAKLDDVILSITTLSKCKL